MFFISFSAHACIFNVLDFAFLLFIYKPCFSTLYIYVLPVHVVIIGSPSRSQILAGDLSMREGGNVQLISDED